MAINFSVDRDTGVSYFDSVAKTQLGFPNVFAKDIEGCGIRGHASSAMVADIKYRNACASPVPAILLSVKGLTSFTATSNQETLDQLLQYVAPVAFNLGAEDITKITPIAAFEKRGTEYVDNQIKAGLGSIRVGIPAKQPAFDNCGIQIGFTTTVSLDHLKIDQDTCKPYLHTSSSVKLFVSTSVPLGITTPGQAEAALLTQLPVQGVLSGAPAGGFSDQATLSSDYVNLFKAAVALNTDYPLGA